MLSNASIICRHSPSAFVAEWSQGKVMRVALTATAAGGYAGTAVTWLTGLQAPVPVIQSPNGALLVGDWGSGTVYEISQ
jgi:hypothetical protein